MKRRKNPAKKSIAIPLILAAGGAYLLLKKPAQPPAPVSGVGDFWSDAVDSVSNAAQQVRNVVVASVSNAAALASKLPGGGITAALLPLEALTSIVPAAVGVSTFAEMKKDTDPPPPPSPVTVYQDENGKEITKAEYDQRMAAAQAPQQQVYKDSKGNVISKAQYDTLVLANTQLKDASKVPTFQTPPAGTEWFWNTSTGMWGIRYKSTTTATTPTTTTQPVVQKLQVTPQQTVASTAPAGSYSGAQNVVQYAPAGGATVAAPAAQAATASTPTSSATNMVVAGGAVVGIPLLLSVLGGN